MNRHVRRILTGIIALVVALGITIPAARAAGLPSRSAALVRTVSAHLTKGRASTSTSSATSTTSATANTATARTSTGTTSTATAATTSAATTSASTTTASKTTASKTTASTASRATSSSTASASTTTPTVSNAAIGALYQAGSSAHNCTASVVDSPSGSLLVTAAHCVSGTGAGMTFVPGLGSSSSSGSWTVTAAYVPSGWLTSANTDDDIAVLRVATKTIDGQVRTIESVVGGEQVGTTVASGTKISTLGYVAGTSSTPVTCTTTTTTTSSGPTVECAGFAGGTSGSPWLVLNADGSRTIVGLIGGANQGGCTVDESNSPSIGTTLQALVARAGSSTTGDTVNVSASSGC